MTHVLMILLGVLLTAGTAVFVAAEFALVTLDRATVETRAASGDRRAAHLRGSLSHLSLLLSGAQAGVTLTTVLLGYTAQAALADLLSQALGPLLGTVAAATAGVAAALVVVNAFSMVFGELVPKNATLADPLRAAGYVVPVLEWFTALTKPVVLALNGTANWVLTRLGITPAEEISGTRSAAELAALVRHSAEEGTLDVSTAALLTRSIGVGRLTAVDVPVARTGELNAVDGAGDLDLHVTVEPELGGAEGVEGRVRAESSPQDVAPVPGEDLPAARLGEEDRGAVGR